MNTRLLVAGWLSCLLIVVLSGCQAVEAMLSPVSPTATPFQPQAPTATAQVFASPTAEVTATLAATPTSTPPPSPTPLQCLSESGRMEYHSQDEGAPLTFRIYLPPCYGALEGQSYPVLYILHGQTYTDDQWDRMGMDEAAEEMILARQVPPFLIVMPLEVDTFADIFVSQHGRHIAEELVPWVDGQFATCARRECRAIGGLSRGGAWSLNTGFDYWQTFSAVGLHSTPPFISGPYRVHQWMSAIPADQLPRLWLDTGRQDWYIRYTSDLESWLTAENMPHEWMLYEGTHDEAYWSSHVVDYLTWYTEPWKDSFPVLP